MYCREVVVEIVDSDMGKMAAASPPMIERYELKYLISSALVGPTLDFNVVFELKTTAGSVPVWMVELTRRFELKQMEFSKYLASGLVENHDLGFRYMPDDRQSN
jgi:hypothetical protein